MALPQESDAALSTTPHPGGSPDDHHAIMQLVWKYARYADERDVERWVDLFEEGAVLQYQNGSSQVVGRQELVEFFEAGRRWSAAGPSTHLMSGPVIEFDDADPSRARGRTAGVAFLTSASGSVVTRGLHYVDEFVHGPCGWKISRRDHRVDWEYQTAARQLSVLGQPWDSPSGSDG